MVTHVWTVLCSRAVIDIESNNVSIQNVIEQLTIPTSPMLDGKIASSMELISFWAREFPDVPATGEGRISLHLPSGEERELLLFSVNLIEHERLRNRIRIASFPASESGVYRFYVEYRKEDTDIWEVVAKIPLTVIFNPPEQDD